MSCQLHLLSSLQAQLFESVAPLRWLTRLAGAALAQLDTNTQGAGPGAKVEYSGTLWPAQVKHTLNSVLSMHAADLKGQDGTQALQQLIDTLIPAAVRAKSCCANLCRKDVTLTALR